MSFINNTGCPTRYRTRNFFNNSNTNEDIATKLEADLPHCVRNVEEKEVLLFKFRCNVFIGVRIIKEMTGSVASGTPCIIRVSKILIEGLSRVEPWKRTTYFGSTYHISTPHPTFSISLSFMGCSHISVFFSPLKRKKNLFFPRIFLPSSPGPSFPTIF